MKNTSALEKRISGLIDKHAAHPSVGRHAAKRESGTLKTLAARLSLPDSDHVLPLIESGRLKSFGSVHRNDPDGTQSYSSADLNEIRREVFTSIAEQVIEDYEGELENLPHAISAALESYASSLKDGTAAKGFSALPRLSVSFAARQDEERPGLIKRAATGAAVAGGLYAGASYLRGRKTGAKGIFPALKAGNAANVADVRKVGGKVSSLLRPRVKFSANLTPARARDLLTRLGREIRRIERA